MIDVQAPNRVLLISPPWLKFNWPSLALGTLKSYLTQHGVHVDVSHFHLEVAVKLGLNEYEEVSAAWGIGEALFSSLYAPSEMERLIQHETQILRNQGQGPLADWAENGALYDLHQLCEAHLNTLELEDYDIIGFTVGALQLVGSIYLSYLVKQRCPHAFVILGGSAIIGDIGESVIANLPHVDLVVDGEGELPLLKLCQMEDVRDQSKYACIPNLVFRDYEGMPRRTPPRGTINLGTLPPPDLSDFYLSALDLQLPSASLVIPLEHSRGCAWEHRKDDGQINGCTFCGLYRASPNFRRKSLDQIRNEIEVSTKSSQVLQVSFVDAYMPSEYRSDILNMLIESDQDYTLFTEMRCNFDRGTADLLARAGVSRVQLGVESFSTPILKRIEKGARAIDNVYAVKLCQEYGIPQQFNIMTRIPGVRREDVEIMEELMPSLYGYTPPNAATFYLDRNSRIYADPAANDIIPESLDCEPLEFLPESLAHRLLSRQVSFRSQNSEDMEEFWQRIEVSVEIWHERFQHATRIGHRCGLTYRRGYDFVTITDLRGPSPLIYSLEGYSYKVFLACNDIVSRYNLAKQFSELDDDTLNGILNGLQEYRILMHENANYLALPVRETLPNGAPRRWER